MIYDLPPSFVWPDDWNLMLKYFQYVTYISPLEETNQLESIATTPVEIESKIEQFVSRFNTKQIEYQQLETTQNRIKVLVQSSVGVDLELLTNAQIKALLAVLLWQRGAIAGDGTIKPLSEWS